MTRWIWILLLSPMSAGSFTDLADNYGGCVNSTVIQTIDVGPVDDYQGAVDLAQAGDRIRLASGSYSNGLRIYDLNAQAGSCILIEGPADRSAVFVGQPINGIRNVVQIRNSSYLVLRNLDIDGTNTTDLDGIKSDAIIEGSHPFAWSHHVTLENLHIHDFDADQQQVGISTKGPAWNWVIRQNTIERVGTGIYLGNSDGAEHFVNGLIEFNLIRDTIGYNMQIKHQFAASRPAGIGFETLPATGQTVIRHNVYHKSGNSSLGPDARPNLLVGAFPLTLDGSNDDYLIHANFFFQNPTGNEALFQGEGNVVFFGNLLFNNQGPGLFIQPQNGEVRRIRVFQNTVLSSDDGIFVSSNANMAFQQLVSGNAIFANGTALTAISESDNIVDTLDNADQYLVNPTDVISGAVNRMDLYPLTGSLTGTPIDTAPIAGFVDSDRDFNDLLRGGLFRGAYAGEGSNPGWRTALEIKPEGPSDTLFSDGFEN